MLGVEDRNHNERPALRRWDETTHSPADVSPHPSLRADLVRHPTPPTWVLPTRMGVSIIHAAARVDGAVAGRRVSLPPSTAIEIGGPVDPSLHIRITDPAAVLHALTVIDSTGRDHEVPMNGHAWCEMLATPNRTTVTTAEGETVIIAGSLAAFGLDPRRPSTPEPYEQVGITLATTSETSAADPSGGLVTAVAAVAERLDATIPAWRSSHADGHPVLSTDIVATRVDRDRSSILPRGRVELVGFLSDTWQRRIESERWGYVTTAGEPIDPTSLDGYGRSGGLVSYVVGNAHAPASDAAGQPRSSDPAVFEGPRAAWVTARRNAETVLQQLAMGWYAAVQHDRESDPSRTPSITDLLEPLVSLWHPAFAWHIDVVEILVRGMNRYRWSDPHYPARAPGAVTTMSDHLAALGIGSRPVVLS